MLRGRALGGGALAGLLLAPLIALAPARAASSPVLPSQDPFYTYSGRTPLKKIRPGTVLKQRSVQLAFGAGNSTPIPAEQVLYRTTGQLGQPTVTVTTVVQPATAPVVPRIVDYLSFYDGLGSQCDPSYTLAGGDPGDSTYAGSTAGGDLIVNPAQATLSLSGLVFTYDGSPHAATVGTLPVGLGGVTVSYTRNNAAGNKTKVCTVVSISYFF